MIPKECKRLAEVDFPIAEVSKHSAGEKYAGKGYPNTLHMWWARRPYGACRAMMLALILPDPCDPHCPDDFKTKAREILESMPVSTGTTDQELQRSLLDFIGSFADWDLSYNAAYIACARSLVKVSCGSDVPLAVDPFAGGGSIPLEALRLGCEIVASDVNPVACLILRVLLEDIPRQSESLDSELQRLGNRIKSVVQSELMDVFPRDKDGSVPIAYLWARTVRCESPDCGAEIPIFRSGWLSKKQVSRARYFKEDGNGNCRVLLVDKAPRGGPITFRIAAGFGSEDEKSGFVRIQGTKAPGNNANIICPCCKTVLPGNKANPRVQEQLSNQMGGTSLVFDAQGRRTGGTRLLTVVTCSSGRQGRAYRLPTSDDYSAVYRATRRLNEGLELAEGGKASVHLRPPDEQLPPLGTLGFRVQRYGMTKWSDLFSQRQLLTLLIILKAILQEERNSGWEKRLLSCAFSRVAMSSMSCTRWNPSAEKMQHTFGRQAIPMVWDFVETVPTADAPGNWESGYELIRDLAARWPKGDTIGQVEIANACDCPLSDESADIWFTDPPYYDAVPYADLSDFFFVWLKRLLPDDPMLRDPFDASNPLTPKAQEVVQDRSKQVHGRPKDKLFFEDAMADAFSEGRRVLKPDGIGCVVFAHKTTEGWEALLSGMSRGGLTITASWPIATEMKSRLRARDSAALATSVHLVCRPRPENAAVGDWADVLRELPRRVGNWMERLQSEGIHGADLVFACIGPALEIFSRYRSVETADGREVKLGEYLEKVWETVSRMALEQILGTSEAKARNSVAGAIEEDARLTALFLWTLQSTNGETSNEDAEAEQDATTRGKPKGLSLAFDIVRRFAQPLGIDLPKWEDRIVETQKGVVRLMTVSERAKQLFGEDGADAVADWITDDPTRPLQQVLFPEMEEHRAPKIRGRGRRKAIMDPGDVELQSERDATTLDRVHAAMLLQAGGQANAMRALIKAEQDRGPDFLRLANALSALYPKGSEEKRLLDAMLLAVPR